MKNKNLCQEPEIFTWQPRLPRGVTVQEAVERVLKNLDREIARKQLVVELDLELASREVGRQSTLDSTLERFLALAIERSRVGGEILITAVETEAGTEIEIADSSLDVPPALENSRLTAFQPTVVENATTEVTAQSTTVGEQENVHVYCARCPQGGLAWTVVRQEPLAVRRAA